jgi:hypothetical protein
MLLLILSFLLESVFSAEITSLSPPVGGIEGGTLVTITGTGLSSKLSLPQGNDRNYPHDLLFLY